MPSSAKNGELQQTKIADESQLEFEIYKSLKWIANIFWLIVKTDFFLNRIETIF